MGEFVSFRNLNQCMQMIRHEKNQGAVPTMQVMISLRTS